MRYLLDSRHTTKRHRRQERVAGRRLKGQLGAGQSRLSSRADTALTGDFLNLIAKNRPPDSLDNPLPILKAQPESFWAGHRYGHEMPSSL